MKVLIYAEARKFIGISGIGCAVKHQIEALKANSIDYTTDENDDFNVVHINTYGILSRRLAKKAKKQGKLVIYHAHSTEEDFCNSFIGSNLISGFFKKWIVSCYNLGDIIVTPTEYSKSLLEGYGIKKPIHAVSNGIDLAFYEKLPTDRNDFRKKYGYLEQDKVIMSVGLYLERKGILDFVSMAKSMPQYKFIWFGKTPLYSIPAHVRRAVKTKLPNLIFAGYISHDELKKAYHGADLFAFLTHEETEGIVLLEALASRQNVLIRDIPIYKEFKDGRDLYKTSSFVMTCEKVSAIVNNIAPDITENGYATVMDKDICKVGEVLGKVYSSGLPVSKSATAAKTAVQAWA